MTCEAAEIAIGMRQHGALAAEETAVLQAHLDGCASCRAFAAISKSTEQAMQAKMMEEVGAIDWDAMAVGLKKLGAQENARFHRALWVIPVMCLFVLVTTLEPDAYAAAAQTAAFGLAIAAIVWWHMRQRERQRLAAKDSPLELLVVYRQQTASRKTRTRVRAIGLAWSGIIFCYWGAKTIINAGLTLRPALFLSMSAFLIVYSAFSFRAYRRLQAETRELA